MKYLLLAMLLALSGCARRYQVVVVEQASGAMSRLEPQSREGAEKKALVINMTSGGAAVAWTQQAQPTTKKVVLALPKEKEQ